MPNVEHLHQTSGSLTLQANVYSSTYVLRETVALSDTGHLGLYVGSCADMVAGDIIQIEDTSISKFVAGITYYPFAFTSGTVNANIAAGSVGTGSTTVSYYVYSNVAETVALEGVAVWVSTDEAGATIVASGVTNSAGLITFYLDDATYYMWRSKTGYSFTNPDTETVLGA